VLDTLTQYPRQHVFYASGSKSPVAVVTTSGYRSYYLDSEPGSTGEPVRLPEQIQLKISPTSDPNDQVVMEIGLRNVKLNPEFTETNRQALFRVPVYDGYQVVQLNDDVPGYAAGGRTRTNQSRPTPHTNRAIRLEEPAPIGTDDTALRWSDPMPLGADLGAGAPGAPGVEQIARPGIPRPREEAPHLETPPSDRQLAVSRSLYR
jgi:hypothetical protein